MNPSKEYFESMHRPIQSGISNLPEEVGSISSKDGTLNVRGEWIECTSSSPTPFPTAATRNQTVILYFHGGGHAFLSPASHRDFLCRLAKQIGPGTRILSVDYRMAPEHPFPAAIHDAYAAYLYLTDPDHKALNLGERAKTLLGKERIEPRDVVIAGDSAGGNLATAFVLYLAKYVKPERMPHATILLSPWVDPTSSLPAAKSDDWYCYCPGPIGTSPFDKEAYMSFKKFHLASNYVCGDVNTAPNARNAFGKEREWAWYSHLSQHPLVSPAHCADLSGHTDTLLHTATHDRLVDDARLYAHRLGQENPEKLIRIEVYQDMVHVHHVMSVLPAARIAIKNIAHFIARSRRLRDLREGLVTAATSEAEEKNEKGMVKARGSDDNIEWVAVGPRGNEESKDEGWPISVLRNCWPQNVEKEL
ncbi:Alpha/Beta hydrolase protein [Gamsiella multidivaricata]|uniref:Alpha/Beta hydrolase protein n=1 Tax=Gamsiella multidivaricata TaxID=101098 RepID=UPI00221E3B48|nr:Alpha/Beta hydrolase protein [Gamsiella multidivaricata]KAI7818471.1 Alpha/Beta hydrolase protein [Gamsiella multidivaricata]